MSITREVLESIEKHAHIESPRGNILFLDWHVCSVQNTQVGLGVIECLWTLGHIKRARETSSGHVYYIIAKAELKKLKRIVQ